MDWQTPLGAIVWEGRTFAYNRNWILLLILAVICFLLSIFMLGMIVGTIRERMRPWNEHLDLAKPHRKGRFKHAGRAKVWDRKIPPLPEVESVSPVRRGAVVYAAEVSQETGSGKQAKGRGQTTEKEGGNGL